MTTTIARRTRRGHRMAAFHGVVVLGGVVLSSEIMEDVGRRHLSCWHQPPRLPARTTIAHHNRVVVGGASAAAARRPLLPSRAAANRSTRRRENDFSLVIVILVDLVVSEVCHSSREALFFESSNLHRSIGQCFLWRDGRPVAAKGRRQAMHTGRGRLPQPASTRWRPPLPGTESPQKATAAARRRRGGGSSQRRRKCSGGEGGEAGGGTAGVVSLTVESVAGAHILLDVEANLRVLRSNHENGVFLDAHLLQHLFCGHPHRGLFDDVHHQVRHLFRRDHPACPRSGATMSTGPRRPSRLAQNARTPLAACQW